MTHLNIAATQSTPQVTALWADGILKMQGDSYPENSYQFFVPVINWVKEYLTESTAPLHLHLRLLYLNTSIVKAMMDILDLLEEAFDAGRDVAVTWFYDAEN